MYDCWNSLPLFRLKMCAGLRLTYILYVCATTLKRCVSETGSRLFHVFNWSAEPAGNQRAQQELYATLRPPQKYIRLKKVFRQIGINETPSWNAASSSSNNGAYSALFEPDGL